MIVRLGISIKVARVNPMLYIATLLKSFSNLETNIKSILGTTKDEIAEKIKIKVNNNIS